MNEIFADGFMGSLLASESILDGVTILHGPGGCRNMNMSMSTRRLDRERTTIEGDFFFHNSRIPCTYVDPDDYIYGASSKVGLVIDILKSDNVQLSTFIESPAASLIGDSIIDEIQRSGMSEKAVIIPSSFMSKNFSEGFDSTLTMIAEKAVKPSDAKDPSKVNIVGLPFLMRGYEFLLDEIKDMLALMGLEVVTSLGSGSTIEELKASSTASFNIAVVPEYCERLSALYENSFGIPTIISPEGAPVGYKAVRAWYSKIAEATGKDVSPVMKAIDREESRARRIISNNANFAEYARYRTYSISAESSVILPLAKWLTSEFSTVPFSIECSE